MRYKYKPWHLVVLAVVAFLLYQGGFFRPFMGATLSTGDGYILYGEYTLSDYIYSADSFSASDYHTTIQPPADPCRNGFTYEIATSTCRFISCPATYVYDSEKRICVSKTCPTGYTWNDVRKMCELSNSYLATWANEFGFTGITCGTETCDANHNCVINCDSKYWSIKKERQVWGGPTYGGGDPAFDLSATGGGDCASDNGGYNRITTTSKQGFKGKNFKMDTSFAVGKSYYGGPASTAISVGPSPYSEQFRIADLNTGGGDSSVSKSGLIETEESVLDPDIYTIKYQGQKVGDIDVSSWNDIYITMKSSAVCGSGGSSSASAGVVKPRWQLLYSCRVEDNQLLGYEIFQPNQDISVYSTSYPVQHFCLEHPAVVYDQASKGTTTTAEIYERLKWGDTYPIPSGKVIGMFYVFDAQKAGITVPCSDKAYNINTGECFIPGGLGTICANGVMDPARGTCVVTVYDVLCPYGGYYDSAQNKCIYLPPIQYICEYGDYSALLGTCTYVPAVPGECPSTTTWNANTQYCEAMPVSQIICPPYYGYNAVMDKCTRHVESSDFCMPGSEWIEADKLCTIDIPDTPVCPKDGYLTPDFSKCIYNPTTEHQCLQGGNYNKDLDKCIIEPDYDYLCLNGNITIRDDGTLACEITLVGYHICSSGFRWDAENKQCEQVNGVDCSSDDICEYICADGTNIGKCVNGKCYVDESTCPELQVSAWEKMKNWLIKYMLYIMLVLMVINIFILIAQGGRLTFKQTETYCRRNLQGVIIGGITGAIMGLLVLELNPISLTMLLTILTFGLGGAIIDYLWKPKR